MGNVCEVTERRTLLVITQVSSGLKILHTLIFSKYKYYHVEKASLANVHSYVTIAPIVWRCGWLSRVCGCASHCGVVSTLLINTERWELATSSCCSLRNSFCQVEATYPLLYVAGEEVRSSDRCRGVCPESYRTVTTCYY